LDEAIVYGRKAFDLCSPSHPSYATILSNLIVFIDGRFNLRHAMDDLTEVIALRSKAIPFYPPGHPDRVVNLNDLALALRSRFKALGEVEDLQNAVTYSREVLLSCPENPDRPPALGTLGLLLSDRFRKLGKMEDLEEAITSLRESHLLCPQNSSTISNLALSVFTRFEQLGRMDDLEEAMAYNKEALLLCPPGHPQRGYPLNNLAMALSARFERLGKVEDLEGAIVYQREALDVTLSADLEYPRRLNNLASAVCSRFEQYGRMGDLDDAIRYSREGLQLSPPGHSDHFFSLNNLALFLHTRFEQSGKMEDLEDAIKYLCKALDACLPADTQRASALSNLALAIYARFEQLGNIGDLDEAIKHSREALPLQPIKNPSRFFSVNNLAFAHLTRFKQSGKMEDLEDAIEYLRKALDICLPGDTQRARALNNLALAIDTRFEQRGNIDDLDEAIKYNREALSLRPAGNSSRFFSVNNLAATLLTSFQSRGQMEDLVHVRAYMREALDLCPPGNIQRATALNNLAHFLHEYFQQLGGIADLDDAIAYHEEALGLRPRGHPDRWISLNQLALALSTRFKKLCKVNDLKNAIAYHSQAETTLHPDHPKHAVLGPCIASTYLLQYRTNHTREHLTMAFKILERAANHCFAGSKAQLNAALQWVSEARQYQHGSHLRAYSQSLIALDRCLATQLSIESQQEFIATTPKSLALDAAACAITDGKLERAVELLEQGRAIVWARLRGYRHSLEKLFEIDSELAEEFQMLSARLEQHATSSGVEMKISEADSKPAGPPVSIEEKMKQHRILSDKWDVVVSRIREKDGFTDFLRPVPFTTLQQAAKEGPVIVVNVGTDRSDAIILCHDICPPVLVPLPDASPETLARLSTQLSEARAGDAVDCPKIVYGVMRTLWAVVVLPVRVKLAELNVAERTRIWWCPTSELCGLPLHAAGPYSDKRKNFPDIYVSSYTPSLSALISARAGKAGPPTIPNMLVIGQPGATLPRVNDEMSIIKEFYSSLTILSGEGATPEAVLSSLKRHSWAHFACHGIQDPKPYKSTFILHGDKHVTLLELIKARLPDAEFAFLSACHSAAGDLRGTPDEIIHLAAALQFCGFRSVVGTLWAMGDLDAPNMARDFYKYMFRRPESTLDFRDSAVALNRATRQMRGREVPLDRWINFVHIGA
jgi:tetratricopeptide (TPR) repeat protein